MKQELETAVAAACKKLFNVDVDVELTRPDEQFGDFATNVALQLAKSLGKNPREAGTALAEELKALPEVKDASIAGPGFVNLTLSDDALRTAVKKAPSALTKTYDGQLVVLEYSDPNPFKVLHAGHLYQTIYGESVANLLTAAGADVHRVNFGGDVGLHVAKTMWAILDDFGGEHPEKLADIPEGERAEWMARCYVAGTRAYDEDEVAKAEIVGLNTRVYELFTSNDRDSSFAQIYWTCRQWSYDYFNAFYASVGTTFEKYYPESSTAPLGLKTVKEQLAKGVYEESDGAVVFRGEPYGLHTRVFINSNGLPTYEAKDVGLVMSKWSDYHFDRTIIITGNDIVEYMKVVLKSIEQFEPELVKRTTHVTHGQLKLAGGVKMSSRKGNFFRAVDVLEAAREASREATGRDDEAMILGSVKYAFLKQRIGPDVIYDPKESVSLEGNSGPYLQYAHARARSIIKKVSGIQTFDRGGSSVVQSDGLQAQSPEERPRETHTSGESLDAASSLFEAGERSLLRKISEYPEVVDRAVNELMPHHICTYLYELAQTFNRFYEHNHVVGDPREALRLKLVEEYADTLQAGLTLLGIAAPEQI
ncbi:MAG TPA: arginine--tRNA ligase [Candidatus Saccharimonadales bacterium]